MKKGIIFIILLAAIVLTSCVGVETPRMTKDKPFIVTKIKVYDSKNNVYSDETGFDNLIGEMYSGYQAIIAPKGLFNVGDTIKVCK